MVLTILLFLWDYHLRHPPPDDTTHRIVNDVVGLSDAAQEDVLQDFDGYIATHFDKQNTYLTARASFTIAVLNITLLRDR
jgi:hypothetical protein